MEENDLYSFLIGAAPSNKQSQAAIADQLRRRRSFGELGALTGDQVLQPFGQQMSKQADAYATDLQAGRQHDTDNAQTKAYQDAQTAHMKEMEGLTKRGQTLDHIYQMMMAEAAQTKADKTGTAKIPRLRQGDIKDLQDMAQDIGQFNDLSSYLESGKGFGAKKVAGVPIPGSRALANTAARFGFGSDDDKEAFAMKQKFDRMYTLGARNRLFGATLTSNEQKAWSDANPDTRQSDEQIAKALPILKKVFEHRLGQKAKGLTRENYDPDAIKEYADLENLGIDISGGMSGHGTVTAPATGRIKVDAEGNIIGN